MEGNGEYGGTWEDIRGHGRIRKDIGGYGMIWGGTGVMVGPVQYYTVLYYITIQNITAVQYNTILYYNTLKYSIVLQFSTIQYCITIHYNIL